MSPLACPLSVRSSLFIAAIFTTPLAADSAEPSYHLAPADIGISAIQSAAEFSYVRVDRNTRPLHEFSGIGMTRDESLVDSLSDSELLLIDNGSDPAWHGSPANGLPALSMTSLVTGIGVKPAPTNNVPVGALVSYAKKAMFVLLLLGGIGALALAAAAWHARSRPLIGPYVTR